MHYCVQLVIEFIDRNLDEHLSTTSLARLCGRSVHSFRCGFTRAVGVSPRRFVTLRRVRAARSLLSDTDMPLAEIAYAVGFSSQAKFTTSFRRATGVTPGEFRRREAVALASPAGSPHRTSGARPAPESPGRSSGSSRYAVGLLAAWTLEGFSGAQSLLVLL